MARLTIRRNGFVGRLFRFCHATTCAFTGRSRFLQPEHTDVCTLVRTIVLWAPLAVLINVLAIGFCAYACALLLYGLAANYSVVGFLTLCCVSVAIFGLLCWGIFTGGKRLGPWLAQAEATQVAVSWYKAHKESICPLITIREN